MNGPPITVLTSVFNGMPYLPETIDSILASTDVPFEAVIVDNCSTDGSREYLRTLTDSRLRVIENGTNLGQTGALNVGLGECRTPFVARIDADDLMLPDRLAWQAEYLAAHPDVALVGGQMIEFTGAGQALRRTRLPTNSDTLAGRMIVANCFDHSSVSFRRDAAAAAGGYPETHVVSQDFALFSSFLRANWQLRNVDRVAARARAHPGQVMAGPAREREFEEGATVVADNLAWLIGSVTEGEAWPALGHAVRHLITGEGRPPKAETVSAGLAAMLEADRLTERQRALLAVYLFGGTAAGRLGVRGWLLRRIIGLDPRVIGTSEMAVRVVRALVPDVLVPRLGRFAA